MQYFRYLLLSSLGFQFITAKILLVLHIFFYFALSLSVPFSSCLGVTLINFILKYFSAYSPFTSPFSPLRFPDPPPYLSTNSFTSSLPTMFVLSLPLFLFSISVLVPLRPAGWPGLPQGQTRLYQVSIQYFHILFPFAFTRVFSILREPAQCQCLLPWIFCRHRISLLL